MEKTNPQNSQKIIHLKIDPRNQKNYFKSVDLIYVPITKLNGGNTTNLFA